MATGRRISFPLLLLLLTISTTLVAVSVSNTSHASEEEISGDKVIVALYYETLCPYCSNLIVNYLYKFFEDGLDSIAELKLIPYGNAKIGPNNTIACQHGPTECLLNTVEACAIHVWPDVKEHFPFIYCVEKFIYEGETGKWETCFEELNLDPKPVIDCYASGYGDKLELQYAAETNALEPPHTYVPWLVVDGQPVYDDYTNFISYVCKAYKGTALPKACIEPSHTISTAERANGNHQVCYKQETIKTTLSRVISAITSWIRQDNVAISI